MERYEAVVAGAGPAGLTTAAALRRRGVPVVVVERADGVGARWRTRYDGLRLNTMRQFSRLTGLGMRRALGRYPSRDDFVAYLEEYVRHHDLDVRFGTELERVDRDGDGPGGDWVLRTGAGSLRARHAIVATGYDAIPRLPDAPGIDAYEGELVHAQQFRSAAGWAGRDVLVVGGGNTGVDIAGLLDRAGARVSFVMRTPPNIVPRDLLRLPMQPTGILMEKLPSFAGDLGGRLVQRLAFGDLTSHGIPFAPEGYMSKFRREYVGPAVDDGFVAGVKAGRIKVVGGLRCFEGREVVLADGTRLAPDLVLCATGYRRGLEPLVGHLGILDEGGRPEGFDRPLPVPRAAPRLYFAGFFGSPAGQIRYFPKHARRIARAVALDR